MEGLCESSGGVVDVNSNPTRGIRIQTEIGLKSISLDIYFRSECKYRSRDISITPNLFLHSLLLV